MKLALIGLLFLLSPLAIAGDTDYYTKPDHPGRHYDCSKPLEDGSPTVVAYENDQIIVLCEGFSYKLVRPKGLRALVDPGRWEWQIAEGHNAALVKSAPDVKLTDEQILVAIHANLSDPFYDSSEKRMIRWHGWMLAADYATTLAGIHFSTCREANPIFRHAPLIGVALNTWQFVSARNGAKRTSRFFTASRDWENWVPVATHGAAAAWNLSECIL